MSYQVGRRCLGERQSPGDDQDVVLLFTDSTLRQKKMSKACTVHHIVKQKFICDLTAVSYCDVGVGEVGPAEQVHQSVEAGQFTARQLLAFHHRGGFHSVHVVDGSDHPQTWREA